ncbi:MAG: hypothetical protein ACK4Y0_04155 [Bacteroidota bacterium]|mgnify:FL=1|jgi:uncharacterized protein involved in exopolysaccharide biosynthesis
MDQPKELQVNDDEISLKDLIKIVQSWFGLLWKNIILIAFIGGLGASAGFYFAYSHKPVFKAESRFIVKEGGPSGLASSLGSLGSLIGGSGGSSLDKTVAVIGSEKVIGKVLLTSATIGDTNDLVINHYIRLGKLTEKWSKDIVLVKAKFTVADTIPEVFNFPQRKAFKAVLASFIGEKGIVSKSFDKKSGIVSLDVTHADEDFAIELNRVIYNELKSFFQDQASESANMNVAILTKKVDSIQGELNSVRRQLARRTDQSMGIFLNEDKVDLKSLAVKEQILLTMYGEAQKNLETFLFMGQTASSSTALNLLDVPYSPLTPTSKSKILYSGLGFFLASFFTFGFILIRRWYKNLMAS